jgi:hypothetical protein
MTWATTSRAVQPPQGDGANMSPGVVVASRAVKPSAMVEYRTDVADIEQPPALQLYASLIR